MHAAGDFRIVRAARWLVRQHLDRARSRPMPASMAPRGIEEAYAIQDAFVALKASACGAVAGHKIALTTPQMRALVGLNEPIAGRLHARQVVRGPASVRAAAYGRLLVEFEIGARMDADLPPEGAPYAPQKVAAAVGALMPAFELADDRDADYGSLPARGFELAADNAWNEGAVLGEPVAAWHRIDLAALHGVATINGAVAGEGRGADSMGPSVRGACLGRKPPCGARARPAQGRHRDLREPRHLEVSAAGRCPAIRGGRARDGRVARDLNC